jgi:hypothetical protein
MASAPDLTALIRSPEWLAHRYDEGGDAFHFRQVPRATHAKVPFLSDQHLGEAEPVVIPRAAAAGVLAGTPDAPLHFLFHSAYCASTMLVRLFDQPGRAMGLSEPQLLNDMAGWRRRGAAVQEHAAVMGTALDLLARPFAGEAAVVVKPSNVFAALAPAAMVLRPEARAVLLYAPLRDFLLSVARKGLWCRLWCRELLEGYLQDGFVQLGFEPRDYFRQSDLQVAAVGWLAQQAAFARMAERLGPRVATLDSAALTRDPVAAAEAAARHSGTADLSFADHPALRRDSKSGIDFAPGQRDADLAAAEAAYGDEIAQVVGWAVAVADNAGVSMDGAAPLAV